MIDADDGTLACFVLPPHHPARKHAHHAQVGGSGSAPVRASPPAPQASNDDSGSDCWSDNGNDEAENWDAGDGGEATLPATAAPVAEQGTLGRAF